MSWRFCAGFTIVLIGLCFSRLYSYLLFHTVVEMFTVVISTGVFLLAWHTRRFHENHYLLAIGISLLFTGAFDLLHALAYKGMGVFPEDADLATQLWMAGRFVQAGALLISPAFLTRKLNCYAAIALTASVSGLLLIAIFWARVFPSCYIQGEGLTTFKIAGEGVVIAALLGAASYLYRRREELEREIFRALLCSIVLTACGELAFTLYTDVYGALNMVGHLLRFAAVCLVYESLYITGLMRPNLLLFLRLTRSEEALRNANAQLESAVRALKTEEERYKAFVCASSEAICRFEFTEPVPAREPRAHQMVLIRERGRLAECNAVYARMNGAGTPEELIGAPLGDLVCGSPELLSAFVTSAYRLSSIESEGASPSGSRRWLSSSITGHVEDGLLVRIWAIHSDNTARHIAARERERLIAQLRSALAEVQRLGGLLPICSQCKRIRDDKGYWNQVEAYIAERTGAEFSHGICPECARKTFPEFADGIGY